jgi:hypothetical protein
MLVGPKNVSSMLCYGARARVCVDLLSTYKLRNVATLFLTVICSSRIFSDSFSCGAFFIMANVSIFRKCNTDFIASSTSPTDVNNGRRNHHY